MTSSVAETLRAARALINTPEKLCKGTYARDLHGTATPFNSEDAASWCLEGAIKKAGACRCDIEIPYRIIAALRRAGVGKLATDWSDTHTHAEVIAALDAAIAAEEAAP
jgi:hypothetical protein